MVRVLFLGLLLVITMCHFVNTAVSHSGSSAALNNSTASFKIAGSTGAEEAAAAAAISQIHNASSTVPAASVAAAAAAPSSALEEDLVGRSERSTNLSHVTGAARRIQMFIKNRHLQLLPDGTVNGTTDDSSPYTILQRTTVGIAQMKIQGVVTCQYLCMDSCGLLYGSKEYGEECIFKETIEQHNYNSYSSHKYSNDKRTLYLALNRRGQPRKVVLKTNQQLGRLSSYTRVLTRTVASERAEELQLPPMRHHNHICLNATLHQTQQHLSNSNDRMRCRKRKKRKKKKRKCLDDDSNSQICQKKHSAKKKQQCSEDNADSDQKCQRNVTLSSSNINNKLNNSAEKHLFSAQKKNKKNRKGFRKRLDFDNVDSLTTESTPPTSTTYNPSTLLPDDNAYEDYGNHSDLEESTTVTAEPTHVP